MPSQPTVSWTKQAKLSIPAEELWDLMWRPETQPRWFGAGPHVRLERGARCLLTDEAGAWRTGQVQAVRPPTTVTLRLHQASWWDEAGVTTVVLRIIAEGAGKCVVEVVEENVAPARRDEVDRYWSRRLSRLRALVAEVDRRRDAVRQAIVVIHGIGEQMPGATLAGLVRSGVLPEAQEGETAWVKPDRVSGSFDLRRVTFKGSAEDDLPATDVYELYWAHTIRDTTFGHIGAWMRRLLLRWPIPRRLRPLWLTAWLLLAIGVATLAAVAAATGGVARWLAGGTTVAVFIGLAWRLVGRGFLIQVLGDAARYLLPLPANVAHRQAIREAGVDLLERLHDSARYDRIVVLGHSLGTVIAYDVLSHAWDRMNVLHRRPRSPTFQELRAVERNLKEKDAAEAHRLQHAAWRRQRINTQPWLVTDLVTVGSPLAYADLLMAPTPPGFEQARDERILPTCPPATEVEKKTGHFRMSYEQPYRDPLSGAKLTFTQFHHAAPFAVTRWTNLYFEPKWLGLAGDLVGGPVADLFGAWVRDVPMPSPAPRFTHTWYWRPAGDSGHLQVLRSALALEARSDLIRLLREMPAFALLPRE